MQKNNLYAHSVCLISILAIGNTLIYYPFGYNVKSSIIAIALAAVITFLLFLPYCSFFNFLNKNNITVESALNSSYAKPLIFLVIFILALMAAAISTKDYISFIDRYRLVETPKSLIAFSFIAIAYFLSYLKKEAFLKFSLISFLYIIISVPVLFILSWPQFDFENLLGSFPLSDIIFLLITLLAKSFLTVLLTAFFFNSYNLKKPKFAIFLGFTFAALILATSMFNVLLTFGVNTTKNLSIPYAESMSVIILGKAFTRLEGYSYLNYYLCTIIKTAISIYVVKGCTKELFKNKKILQIIMPIILAVAVFIYSNTLRLQQFANNIYTSLVLLILELLFAFAVMLCVIKGLKKQNKNN